MLLGGPLSGFLTSMIIPCCNCTEIVWISDNMASITASYWLTPILWSCPCSVSVSSHSRAERITILAFVSLVMSIPLKSVACVFSYSIWLIIGFKLRRGSVSMPRFQITGVRSILVYLRMLVVEGTLVCSRVRWSRLVPWELITWLIIPSLITLPFS